MDTEFALSQSSKRVVLNAIIGFWMAAPTALLVVISILLQLVTKKIPFNDGVTSLLIAGLGVYASFTLPLAIANQYNRVRVTTDGLWIETYSFYFRWEFVKWIDIYDVKLSPKLDRWGKSQWLVMVRRLTYWHRIISWQYGFGLQPVVVLNSDLINYTSLLEIINKMTHEME